MRNVILIHSDAVGLRKGIDAATARRNALTALPLAPRGAGKTWRSSIGIHTRRRVACCGLSSALGDVGRRYVLGPSHDILVYPFTPPLHTCVTIFTYVHPYTYIRIPVIPCIYIIYTPNTSSKHPPYTPPINAFK